MAQLKKYDLDGKEIGKVDIDDAILSLVAHPQSVKDYLVAIRNNARQWSANTKGRKEVNRTGKKPHPQKGQGRSRQGCLAAPQYKGGGIVFGPKPKFDQHVKINRKERKAAVRSLIIEKIKGNQVHVLAAEIGQPKTKIMSDFLKKLELLDKRVLFLGEVPGEKEPLPLSIRNIVKKEYSLVPNISGYDVALCGTIFVLDEALERFLSLIG